MASVDQVTEIQLMYPQIYMACHTDHVRAATSEVQLSSRDSAILAHLSDSKLSNPSKLAKHLKISVSTLSEAICKLEELDYVQTRRDENDERRQQITLTAKGLDAMKKSSVLDSKKVASLLSQLNATERKRAIEGLGLLAKAALRIERVEDA